MVVAEGGDGRGLHSALVAATSRNAVSSAILVAMRRRHLLALVILALVVATVLATTGR